MSRLSDSQRKLLEQRLRGKAKERSHEPPEPETGPGDVDSTLASLGQEGVFAAHQADPTSPAFNITSSFEVVGPLDLERLETAVRQVVARHEILRSRYRLTDTGVEQIVVEEQTTRIRVETVDDADFRSAAEGLVRQPFELGEESLLRLHLLRSPKGLEWLVLVVHDIVFDKWSLGTFWNEVAALYRASAGEGTYDLPPLASSYRTFIEEQRRSLLPDGLEQQLEYWRRHLEDPPRPLELPTDHSYPSSIADAGRLARAKLTPELTDRLRKIAAAENVSLFAVLLSAYQLLLERWSGASDLVVASPIANRRTKESAELIGFFLSTIPFRWRSSDDSSFREAIRITGDAAVRAIEHQDPPFDRIVEAVRPPRVAGRHPLCQTMFVYQREDEGAPSFDLGDVRLEHIYVDTGTSKYDLTLFAAEAGDGMETILEYRTDLFEPTTADLVLERYGALLENLTSDPDRPLSEAEIISESERARLLELGRGEPLPIEPATVVSSILQSAQAQPDRIAIIGDGVEWSYGDLDRVSQSVAERLREADVQPGDRVGHFMERTPYAIAALLGALRAGAAYVPIDPTYPIERRRLVLEDAKVSATLVSPSLEAALDRVSSGAIVTVGAFDAESTPEKFTDFAIDPTSAAYLIYTSGSTGRPKGVVVNHSSLAHSTAARDRFYGAPPERFLLIPSLSFDSSIAGLFWTLAKGATLVLADLEAQRDPEQLARSIDRDRVTDLLCIPSLYREILSAAADFGIDLRTLQRAIVAGESCTPDTVARHFAIVSGTELFNEYGPTEATVWATAHRMTEADARGTVPIGRPIASATVALLDRNRRLTPLGSPGEIYIVGNGVADGYWGDDERTAERFIELPPELLGDSARAYATGDIGRWRPDGSLEFRGRRDEQVKIRGHRVELGEIEAALAARPDIAEAVALVDGKTRLVAYVVPTKKDDELDASHLRRALVDSLPSYAIPHDFVVLIDFPRLPNGKIDRAALPAPPRTTPSEAHADSHAPTEIGRELFKILRTLLGTREIALDDEFFSLGGDSMIAIQAVSRARAAGIRVRPRDFAEAAHLGELIERAELITDQGEGEGSPEPTGPMPLSPIQRWFFSRDLAAPEHWCLAMAIEIDPAMSEETIRAAVAALVEHHPQLRAGFRSVDGKWRQEITEIVREVGTADLLDRSSETPMGAAARAAQSLRFDGTPLSRFSILDREALLCEQAPGTQTASTQKAGAQTGSQKNTEPPSHTLVVTAHHLIIDAASWPILCDDLALALQVADKGQAVSLPERTDSFARWSGALAALADDSSAVETSYWTAPWGTDLARLPTDRPTDRGADRELVERHSETATRRFESPKLFDEALKPYNNRVEDLLLTALVQTLSATASAEESTRWRIGLERHGRDGVDAFDLSRTIGWFTSAFPIRVETGSDPRDKPRSPAEQIQSMKELLRGVPSSGIGYGRLRYGNDPEASARVGADEASEDVLFNYLGHSFPPSSPPPILSTRPIFEGVRAGENARSHPLEINSHREADALVLHWTFNTAIHDRETIDGWVDTYIQALAELIEHCVSADGAYTPSDFPDAGLDQDELDALLDSL